MNIQKAIAVERAATPITRTNDPIVSQRPLYIELDKTTSQKAVDVNGTTTHATEVTFSGNGTTRDVKYIDSGKGLIISCP
jgi:hypothetical protein